MVARRRRGERRRSGAVALCPVRESGRPRARVHRGDGDRVDCAAARRACRRRGAAAGARARRDRLWLRFAVADGDRASDAAPLVRDRLVGDGAVGIAARPGGGLAAVDRRRACRDGVRQSRPRAQRLDRRRRAARARRRETVCRRSVARRQHRADRLVHRRRPAAVADRLSRARAGAEQARMKALTRLGLAIAVVVLALDAAAQTPRDFAWRYSLATEGEHAYYALRLPAAVYEGAVRDDLGDLRIFNGDGSAVPYAMLPLPAPARERPETVELALFPLFVDDVARNLGDLSLKIRRDAAGTSVDVSTRDGAGVAPKRLAGYLVDAGERSEPFAALSLRLANAANVDARVRVDGSDDLVDWRTLASSAPLLALEYRGQRLVRDRVVLTGGAARYLRITFAPSSAAVELAAVRGEFRDRAADVPREWREVVATVDREHPGDYVFDVGGSFPVDRLTLMLPEVNTVAPAQIFAAVRAP